MIWSKDLCTSLALDLEKCFDRDIAFLFLFLLRLLIIDLFWSFTIVEGLTGLSFLIAGIAFEDSFALAIFYF